jgi:hypothetical protein
LNRWEEEVELVNAEMGWTIAMFEHNAKLWHGRALKCVGKPEWRGRESYALQQKNMWVQWAAETRIAFSEQ